MASIADLFGRLLLDDSGFEAAVVKSADKAGTKAGQSLGASLSKSFKSGGLAVLSAVFAGAAKGAVELDTAVKQYAADVGASAEESDKAKAAATELFKTNRQGYDEILQTLAKLRTDQGLSIDQADDLAAAYLRWAKVARTDAPAAVAAFDDVLDAFNLKAADGVVLMDLLVASNQRYGGSLTQRLADLKALAPSLQGFNLTVEDGIALENLFATAGLDAGSAQKALNQAVKNLKPGQTFDDLIRQISSIEDPTQRAQKAMEIFGARGGTQLAQALRPGIDSLADFKLNATDSAGAVEKASKEIDSSIPAQFQLALKNIGGSLTELIGPAGSIAAVITGLASLGVAFDLLKIKAIAAWLATLGPLALAAGAGVAFVLLVDATSKMDAAQEQAAVSAGDLAGAQAKLKAEAEAGTISWDEYDSNLSAVIAQQELQARVAVLAAGGTNEMADAAGKAAVANDRGATAAELAAMAAAKLAAEERAVGTAATGADGPLKTVVATMTTGQSEAKHLADEIFGVRHELTEVEIAANLADAALSKVLRSRGEVPRLIGDVPQGTTTSTPGAGQIAWMQTLREAEEREERDRLERLRKAKEASDAYNRDVTAGVKDSFAAQRTAADAFFDALHRSRLDDIEDARKTANAELEAQKDALFAGVDAAQDVLDAKRKAQQRQGLQQARASAAADVSQAGDDPRAIADAAARLRAAREALADFDAQAKIDADRATAQAAVDALTAQQKANDDKAALAVDGENQSAAARKKAFDDGLAKLENDLLTEKGSHKKTLAAIAKLYVDAGIDTKNQGAQIALGLAAGLLSEVEAVESAAKTLAKAVAKYIRTGSPAEAGPLHEMSPEQMGRKIAVDTGKGLLGGFADLAPVVRRVMEGIQAPAMSVALAGGPIAPGAAMAAVPALAGGDAMHVTVDLGTEFTRLFGGNRFIDVVSRELAWRRRS